MKNFQPVEGNIDWYGGGGEEVRDEVPPDDLAVRAAGLQEGGGDSRVLAPEIR